MRRCIESICRKQDMGTGHVDLLSHHAWELIYLVRGTVRAEIVGRSYIAKAPAIIVISNYEPHLLTISSEQYERYVLTVDPFAAKNAIQPQFLQTVFSVHPPQFCHVIPIEQNAAEEYAWLLQALLKERQEPAQMAGGEQIWLTALLWRIYRTSPCSFSTASGSAEEIVSAVRTELETRPEQKLDLHSLAEAHFISPYYLSHVFHRITGYSIKRYLLLCRISKACTLLSSSEQKITQIAAACGFSDVSNFSRSFRAIAGMTPWEYRKIESP